MPTALPSAEPVVDTASGKGQGRTEAAGTRVFRGIPSARPPVGTLRFRPPQPAEPWAGLRRESRRATTELGTSLRVLDDPGGDERRLGKRVA